MKAIATAKAYLRKRRTCTARNRAAGLCPLRISKKKLNVTRQAFARQVDAIGEQIRDFRPQAAEKREKQPFTGYRILSYNGDAMGKVLKKDGRIFRGIYAESAQWFQKLWDTGLIQTLAKEGMMPKTTLTDFATEEFPIILEHQTVEISTAKLWNPSMVRDACITITLVDAVCRRFGYKLIDGHLNNITFAAGKPVFTDIGSIVEDRGQYTAYESSLIFAGGYKLLAAALGNSILDRLQFFDENNNAIWPAPFCYDEATRECRALLKSYRRWHIWHSSPTANAIIFRLFELGEVEPAYFSLLFADSARTQPEENNHETLVNAISSLGVASATVVGGPVTLGQQLHDRLGLRTVVLDHTVQAAKASYAYADGLSCYCYNYLYGGDADSQNCIRTELAVAEHVTENLVSYQNWKLESLFNGLSKLTSRYVAVSYRPGKAAKRCVDSLDTAQFEKKFSAFFSIVSVTETEGARIYIGEKPEAGQC